MRERLDEIAARHGVELLLRFGSTVGDRTHRQSDLDLAALLCEERAEPLQLGALAGDLQACFPGSRIDLALLNHADPLFLKKVTERCELVHGDARRLAEFKAYAFRRYVDHRRFLALERVYVRRRLGLAAGRSSIRSSSPGSSFWWSATSTR